MSAGTEHCPVLLRIGGVSSDSVEGLSSDLCARVGEVELLAEELQQARAEVVDRLFQSIRDARPEDRGFLLTVKRDCFNGRPLDRHRQNPLWERIRDCAGVGADRLLDLEQRVAEARARFESEHEETVARHREWLAKQLVEPAFGRGLALASRTTADQSDRLQSRPPDAWGRRERRLEQTLARYLSRAALKLSPFSSFTPVAVGRLVPGGPQIRLLDGGWRERSLVRIKRYLLDQYLTMLRRYRPFRDRCHLTVNGSLFEAARGRLLFLRPDHWALDETGTKLKYHRESLVRVHIDGPLIDRLRELLDEPRPYGEVVPLIAESFGRQNATPAIRRQVDQLVEIGFLELLLPWPDDEGHLESRLLDELRGLPATPELASFIERLETLVRLERAYGASRRPVAVLREMEASIGELWRAAAPLGGLSPEVQRGRPSVYNLYHDVLRLPRRRRVHRNIAEIDAGTACSAIGDLVPLAHLSMLFDPRQDFLLALSSFASEKLRACRVGVVELFDEAQPLWQDFVRFQVQSRTSASWPRTWNPLDLPAAEDLQRCRTAAWSRLSQSLRDEPCPPHLDQSIDPSLFDSILSSIPARYRSLQPGACLFLQPAAADGSLWVLNRLKEGTGRFGSRYTPAMDPGLRRAFGDGLAARGAFELNGERVELLDLLCPQGDTLNVHAPQTPKVLTLPGARSSLPTERTRRLADLEVHFSAESHPVVRDRGGCRYLPVQLGVGYYDYLPTLIKFLCVFGPSELSAVFPLPRRRSSGGVERIGRTRIGQVVIQRRTWQCDGRALVSATEGLSDAAAFAAVTRWREVHDIPERAFLIERVPHPVRDDRYQPQYVDFTSPVLLGIFRSALAASDGRLTLVEMLPTPEMLPRSPDGRRWAVELLLDSLGLRAPAAIEMATGGKQVRRERSNRARSGSQPKEKRDARPQFDRPDADRAPLRRGAGDGGGRQVQ